MRKIVIVAAAACALGGSAAQAADPLAPSATTAARTVLFGTESEYMAYRATLAESAGVEVVSLLDALRTESRTNVPTFSLDEIINPVWGRRLSRAALVRALALPTPALRYEATSLWVSVGELRRALGTETEGVLGAARRIDDAAARSILARGRCGPDRVRALQPLVLLDGAFGRMRSTATFPYVKDFDVEGSMVWTLGAQIVGTIEEGIAIDLCARRGPDGVEIEASAAWADAKRPIERFTGKVAGVETAVTVQLPEVRTIRAYGTARVPIGDWLLLAGGLPPLDTNEIPVAIVHVLPPR